MISISSTTHIHEVDIVVNLHMTYDLTVYISMCRTSDSVVQTQVMPLSCTFQRAVPAAVCVCADVLLFVVQIAGRVTFNVSY